MHDIIIIKSLKRRNRTERNELIKTSNIVETIELPETDPIKEPSSVTNLTREKIAEAVRSENSWYFEEAENE